MHEYIYILTDKSKSGFIYIKKENDKTSITNSNIEKDIEKNFKFNSIFNI